VTATLRRTTRSTLRAGATLVALLLALLAPSARASERYPNAIERALDTPCPPDCTTCHTTRKGGALTANTPVGISARRAGLEGDDTSLLLDVLGTLETNGTDSDADGTPDIDELRAGTNPNAAEGELACWDPPPMDEGCAVNACSSQRGARPTWPLGTVLGLAALAALRRRRPSQSQ
jgi:MYXO-CTERM domain-containing protein